MEDLSPKSKLMMEYMKKLEEKIENLEGVMITMKLVSCNSKSCRSHRSEKVVKMHERTQNEPKKSPWDLIKGKIPPFSNNGSVDDYYDWELKVEQNIDCINCEDLIKWNEIALQIRGMRGASIES
ncbi:hypothetical protein CR513_04547, partial [Mucuna pruriens]